MISTFEVNADIHAYMDKITKLNLSPSNQKDCEHLGETVISIVYSPKDKPNPIQSAYTRVLEKAAQYERVANKEVPLLDSNEMITGYKGVSYDYFVDNDIQDELDKIERLADMDYNIKVFLDKRRLIYITIGKDIWRLLYLSKSDDNKKAQKKLKAVLEIYNDLIRKETESELSQLDDILKYIITTPECFSRLVAMLN